MVIFSNYNVFNYGMIIFPPQQLGQKIHPRVKLLYYPCNRSFFADFLCQFLYYLHDVMKIIFTLGLSSHIIIPFFILAERVYISSQEAIIHINSS